MTPAVRFAAALLLAAAAPTPNAELATERYAPVQLRVASDFLERAEAAEIGGEANALIEQLAREP
jgi:hypothetical protein